jgi:hypothetical protein
MYQNINPYKNWNYQKGNIAVCWKSSDYENLNFKKRYHRYSKKKIIGFDTDKKNFKLYGDNLSVLVGDSFQTPAIFIKIASDFLLKETVVNVNKYEPGMILPWHKDTYVTYAKNKKIKDIELIVRIIIFLNDSVPGQQLWIGDSFCYGPAGSWFSWQGEESHMAANLSLENRYVLQITGLVDTSTNFKK